MVPATKESFPFFFDFSQHTRDMHNIFRAIMFLYLGMAALWILGIFKETYWKTATISNLLFMAALAVGRLISLILDGTPSLILIIGLLGEAVLGVLAYLNLWKYGT